MKIAALVSGGVDSSLALKLLKDQGHDVSAFYLKIWLEDELSTMGLCPWKEDLSYVEKTCKQLGVPFHVIALQKEYYARIVAYTIAEAKAGRTPNPDILCNKYIKFGSFYDVIDSSFEKVATGHYARLEEKDGIYTIKQAPDPVKDQSYFLCKLSQKQLARALFPIGHLTKRKVRSLAKKYNLPAATRKDSQGICFLGKFKFRTFLEHHLGKRPGKIIEFETRQTIGVHDGFWYYTIGQRRDIRLSGGPWYVVAKNVEANIVYVSHSYDQVDEKRQVFSVTDFHWLAETKPEKKELLVKIRHRSTPAPCTVAFTSENKAKVRLKYKDQGIASGQFAVFYDGKECLGSGIIE